jgi:glycosyltransferase involved in cell wall biosynthesis
MKSAQVSLVAIAQAAENVVVPSKLFSALVAGHAIVAIAPRNSDLAEIVVKHDCGWVVSPGDGAGLYRVLAEEVSCPLQLQRKRLNAFRVGHLEYSSDAVAKLWDQELQLLVSKQDTRGCVL